LKIGRLKIVILRSCPGWANAHDVQEVWKSVLKQRAIRVEANPEKERTIMISDIEISLKEMIGRRKVYISPEKAWNGPSLKSLIKQQLKKLQA